MYIYMHVAVIVEPTAAFMHEQVEKLSSKGGVRQPQARTPSHQKGSPGRPVQVCLHFTLVLRP